ncbi:MAG: hypothetical protein R3F61_28065 [Myxococcota bacterium]
MIALALTACGPSLPAWVPELGVEPVLSVEDDEVRLGVPPGQVAEWLLANGWRGWDVVDESPVDSHHLRLERGDVWMDLRSTDDGSRLLRLDGLPAAQPAPEVVLPALMDGDPAERLLVAQGCQAPGADVRFMPGRYQWSGGRVQAGGTWTIDGTSLVLEGAQARRCEGVKLVGTVLPQLVTCGPEPLVWCGVPAMPTLAVLDAGGGPEAVARAGAHASRPLDQPSYVFSGPAPRADGLEVRYAPDVVGAAERAKKLAYRLRRDLGVPIALGRSEPTSPSAVAAVVVVVGIPVTSGQ